MVRVICNLCGSGESRSYLDVRDRLGGEIFHLVECRECRTVYTNPRPSALEMPRYYPDSLYQGDLAVAEKRAIVKRFLPEGGVLDIGCGRGFFLAELGNRYEAVGMDIDNVSLDIARQKPGVRVIHGDITGLPPDSEPFDLITFWHSLEHLTRPKESLERARQLLKKDGLLIVAVPNISSLQAGFFGRHWYHLDVPRHFYHFSPPTLTRLLEEEGFSVIEDAETLFSHNVHGWWRSVFNSLRLPFDFPDEKRIKKAGRPSWYLSKLLFVFLWLPARLLAKFEAGRRRPGTLVFVARK